ncbi:MAG TPA: hypothetical protein VIH57_25850 [Bacteroidales bacterium]
MNKIFCPNCYNEFETEPDQCNCGYPFHGTEIDKYNFMSGIGNREIAVEQGKESASNSRNILFFIGGASLVLSLLFMFFEEDHTNNMITIIYSLILIGLGFYSYKEPFFALLMGLIVVVLGYLMMFILNPVLILSGLLTRIIIIAALIYGLITIRRSKKIAKEP